MADGVAVLQPDGSNVRGVVRFIDEMGGLRIIYRVTGLTDGEHGFHIHEYGDLTDGCKSACAHFNPDGMTHGGLDTAVRHFGDLGNITSSKSVAEGELFLANGRLDTSRYGILGRMIIVHADRDDLGMGGDEESLKTGNAGKRLACGVIGLADPDTDTMTMDAESTSLATLGVGVAAAGLGFLAGRRDSRTLEAPYQPDQEISDYTPRDLATSSAITGDFTTDSLKYGFGPTSLSAEDDYEATYGKEQAKIRRRLKNKLMGEATMGTKAGEWSARKSQELKRRYEAACERKGLQPYKGSKTSKQKDLTAWSKQGWRTASGRKSSVTGEPYFPAKAVQALKERDLYSKAKRQKAAATRAGKQRATYSDDIRAVVARYRAEDDHTIDDLDSDTLINRMDAIGALMDEIVRKHGDSYEKAERDPTYLRLASQHNALARAYARREGFSAEDFTIEEPPMDIEEEAQARLEAIRQLQWGIRVIERMLREGNIDDAREFARITVEAMRQEEDAARDLGLDPDRFSAEEEDDDSMEQMISDFVMDPTPQDSMFPNAICNDCGIDVSFNTGLFMNRLGSNTIQELYDDDFDEFMDNGYGITSRYNEDTLEWIFDNPHLVDTGYRCTLCELEAYDDAPVFVDGDDLGMPDRDAEVEAHLDQCHSSIAFSKPPHKERYWNEFKDRFKHLATQYPKFFGGNSPKVLGRDDSGDGTDADSIYREAEEFESENDPVSRIAAGTNDALADFANAHDTDDGYYFVGGLIGGLLIAVAGNIISDRLQDWWRSRSA